MWVLIKFNATKSPKKNDAIKLIIEIILISKPKFILKLFCINILSNNPNVLPNKIKVIE